MWFKWEDEKEEEYLKSNNGFWGHYKRFNNEFYRTLTNQRFHLFSVIYFRPFIINKNQSIPAKNVFRLKFLCSITLKKVVVRRKIMFIIICDEHNVPLK